MKYVLNIKFNEKSKYFFELLAKCILNFINRFSIVKKSLKFIPLYDDFLLLLLVILKYGTHYT